MKRDDEGIAAGKQGEAALVGETARSVDDKVEVLIAHVGNQLHRTLLAAQIKIRNYLIGYLDVWELLSLLPALLDDALLRIGVEKDETEAQFGKVVGKHDAVGGLAYAALLVGKGDNLVALLLWLVEIECCYTHRFSMLVILVSGSHNCQRFQYTDWDNSCVTKK